MIQQDKFGISGGGSGLSGVRGYDWLRQKRRREQEPVRGTNVAIQPASTGGTVCGRMIDSSVNVNGLGGIPITPNSIDTTMLQGSAYVAPTYQPASFSATPQANVQGVLQDILTTVTVNNIPQDGSVARVLWSFRRNGSMIWTPWAETQLGGLPNPAAAQQLSFGFGQLSNGVAYDFGLAFVSVRGDVGATSAFVTNYTAPNSGLAIPSQYLAGGSAYTPALTGVGTSVVASANGISASVTADVTITNQPTDGSLSRVSFFYRVSDPAHPGSAGSGAWSFYGSLPATGVGLTSPPSTGSYAFTFADLSNGVGYDFALACENAQGGETVIECITYLTAQAIVIGSPQLSSMPNANAPTPSGIALGTAVVHQTTYDQPITFSLDSIGTSQSPWLHFVELVSCPHSSGAWVSSGDLVVGKATGGAGYAYTGTVPNLSGGTSYDIGVRYVDFAGGKSNIATLGTSNTVNTPVTGSVGPNLIPDSNLAFSNFNASGIGSSNPYWNFYLIDGASFIIGRGSAANGSNYLGVRPGDSGKACSAQTEVMTTIPGQTYAFGCYIDATTCTGSNQPFVAVTSTDLATSYKTSYQTIGSNGIVQNTWLCPAGVTQVTVQMNSNYATIASSLLIFAAPQFQLGTQLGPYVPGPLDAGPPAIAPPPSSGSSGGGAANPAPPAGAGGGHGGGNGGGGGLRHQALSYQLLSHIDMVAGADNSYFKSGGLSARHFYGGNSSDYGAMVDSSSNLLYGRHAVAFQHSIASDGTQQASTPNLLPNSDFALDSGATGLNVRPKFWGIYDNGNERTGSGFSPSSAGVGTNHYFIQWTTNTTTKGWYVGTVSTDGAANMVFRRNAAYVFSAYFYASVAGIVMGIADNGGFASITPLAGFNTTLPVNAWTRVAWLITVGNTDTVSTGTGLYPYTNSNPGVATTLYMTAPQLEEGSVVSVWSGPNVGSPTNVDFGLNHSGKQLDNIGDGSVYGRPILTRLNAGRPWIDFSEGIHANKHLGNIPDTATRFAAIEAGADKTAGKSLDILIDGTTFKRVAATEMANNAIARLYDGTNLRTVGALATAIDPSGNLLASDFPTQTVHQTSGTFMGWELATATHIDDNNGYTLPTAVGGSILWATWHATNINGTSANGWGPTMIDGGNNVYLVNAYGGSGQLLRNGSTIVNLAANTANDGSPHTWRMGVQSATGGQIRVIAYCDDTLLFDTVINAPWTSPWRPGFRSDYANEIYVRDYCVNVGKSPHDHMARSHTVNFDVNGALQNSTGLNKQGSVVPIAATGLSAQGTYPVGGTPTVTISWSAYTVLMPDGSTASLAANSVVQAGLTANAQYYYTAYLTVSGGVATMNLGGNFGANTLPSQAQQYAPFLDTHIPITSLLSCATPSTQGGAPTGGSGGGGGTCPSEDQPVLTKERGLIPAGEYTTGMHLMGPDGEWVKILGCCFEVAQMMIVTIEGEPHEVDTQHLWEKPDHTWIKTCDLTLGTILSGGDGKVYAPEKIELGIVKRLRKTSVEGGIFRIGKLIGHNVITR